jgi:hypothetical protein
VPAGQHGLFARQVGDAPDVGDGDVCSGLHGRCGGWERGKAGAGKYWSFIQ